jgi:hypothetical protein
MLPNGKATVQAWSVVLMVHPFVPLLEGDEGPVSGSGQESPEGTTVPDQFFSGAMLAISSLVLWASRSRGRGRKAEDEQPA